MAARAIWSDEKAESVQNLCNTLIESSGLLIQKGQGNNNRILQYKRLAVATIKLKHFNREIQQAVEEKRKEVERGKEKVEMLKLKLENVLYKKAYLQREIRVLRDFTTPELNAVEKEIGRPLAAVVFSAKTLAEIESEAKAVMNGEIVEREETSKKLEQLTAVKASKEEILDKKRKFLDDIPLRMTLVKASTADIQAQFDAYKNGLNSADEIPVSTPSIKEENGDDYIEVEGDDDCDGTREEGEEIFENNDTVDKPDEGIVR